MVGSYRLLRSVDRCRWGAGAGLASVARPNRDEAKLSSKRPATWPKELTQKWKMTVGDGVATPALVGDKLYVFSRQDGNEITRSLNAANGDELWQEKYAAEGATGPASGFSGPRSSPVVFDGKIVTLGVRGALSCLDAVGGKKLWRKNDFQDSLPRFFTSCSPIVVNGHVIVQLGGEGGGAIVAYDLATGDEKWKWTGDGTAYASPVLLTIAGSQEIVAETKRHRWPQHHRWKALVAGPLRRSGTSVQCRHSHRGR